MCRMGRCEGHCEREGRDRPESCRRRSFTPLTITTSTRSETHHLEIQPPAATIEIKSATPLGPDVANDGRLAA